MNRISNVFLRFLNTKETHVRNLNYIPRKGTNMNCIKDPKNIKVVDLGEKLKKRWTANEMHWLSIYCSQGKSWQEISKSLNRPSSNCHIKWMQMNCTAKMGRWKKKEEEILQSLVKIYGNRWKEISSRMPTRRTVFQCIMKHRQLTRKVEKGDWVEDENIRLRQLVEKYSESNWEKISEEMIGRSSSQCREHWNYMKHGKKGKWTDVEVKLLKEHIDLHGPQRWRILSEKINRTEISISLKYHRTLKRFEKDEISVETQ
jgi:hypothetical protein